MTGSDPAKSVVNRYLQSWDAHNVFVVGASAFPQISSFNPTGTVARLAKRPRRETELGGGPGLVDGDLDAPPEGGRVAPEVEQPPTVVEHRDVHLPPLGSAAAPEHLSVSQRRGELAAGRLALPRRAPTR